MLRNSILALCLLLSSTLFTQKKALSISDFAQWQRIENRQISNNGLWVAYEINKQKGDGVLVIYNASKGTNDSIQHGYAAQFSSNSDFVVFKNRIPEDSLRKLKLAKTKKEKMPKETVGILNLNDKNITTLEEVKSFKLADDRSNYLTYLIKNKELKQDSNQVDSANIKKKSKKETHQLVVLNPIENKSFSFNHVDTFSTSAKGSRIVFIQALNDSSKIKVLLAFDPISEKLDTLLKDSTTIKNLTLDERGESLAFMASTDTAKIKNYSLWHTSFKKISLQPIVDSTTIAYPTKLSPSLNRSLFFSKDGSKLFFGLAPLEITEPKDSVLDEEKPKLDLWSHTDPTIQPRQLNELARKRKQTLLAIYRIDQKKCLLIADSVYEDITLTNSNNAEVALGVNREPYLRTSTWSSKYLADYAIIDLKTAKTIGTIEAKSGLKLSTEGKYSIWYDYADSAYHARNNKTLKTQILTKSLPISFVDEQHDTPNQAGTYGIAGWTEKDDYVLIYDRYDIWKIDPSGKQSAINLTNGRASKTTYRYLKTDLETNYIAEKESILLSATNETDNASAYCAINIASPSNKTNLYEGDFMTGAVRKALHSDHIIWSTQTVKDYPEIKYSNLNFEQPKTISTTNPQQAEYNWLTVKFVSWNSFAGDSLRGLLYKPENFDPTKKYPMVVYFYERSSETSHRYHFPQPSRSIISIPFYVSNDYLVFVPDIVYKTGYPGQSAYNAIVSGVQQLAIQHDYIDAARIGLQGQSWGGYQIAHLVTQTNIFAAAMAGAPVSNMTSAYGGIRWATGMSRQYQYEETQSRIGGTLWEKPLLYLENSPVFMAPKIETPLLIMANDRDGAVPWYQGIELFMALYRLDKPVWMINYNGMEHNLESKYWANRIDLSTRMFGFFNHYLKDEKAPEWLIKGIPAIEKGKNLGY